MSLLLFRLRQERRIILHSMSAHAYGRWPLIVNSGPISMAELYFGIRINPAVAIFFMWAVVWVGYSYAAIARQFLLYDPQYPWFSA